MTTKNIKEKSREMLGIKNENDVPKWLDAIIDLAIAEKEKEIVNRIDNSIDTALSMSDWKAHSVLEDIKNFITNNK